MSDIWSRTLQVRRWCGVVGAALLSLHLAAAPMGADPGATSVLNWVFNGAVHAAARVGDTLYVGGTFTHVAPSANALGSVFAVSATSGAVTAPVFPRIDGVVSATESDGAGGFYVAGTFTRVGATARTGVVHILADGSLDPVFAPSLTGTPSDVVRVNTTLYVVGDVQLGGVTTSGAVALNGVTGASLAFQPPLGFRPLEVLATGGTVIIGGTEALPGALSAIVGAYDATTGAEQWRTVAGPGGVSIPSPFAAMVLDGTRVIVAHARGVRALSAASGAIEPGWDPQVTQVNAMTVVGSTLYLGGSFSEVAGQPRANLAAVDRVTAAVLPWNPPSAVVSDLAPSPTGGVFVAGFLSSVGTTPRRRLAEIDAAGVLTSWEADPKPDLVASLEIGPSGALIVGGSLAASGNVARGGLAAFDLTSGSLLAWHPATDRGVQGMAAVGTTIYLSGTFTTVAGVPRTALAAVDGVSGAVQSWPAAPVGAARIHAAHDGWIYASIGSDLGDLALRRLTLAGGEVDASWLPAVQSPNALQFGDDVVHVAGTFPFGATTSGLGQVDLLTGQTRSVSALLPGVTVVALALDGDTLYLSTSQPGLGARAIDARNGLLLSFSPAAPSRTVAVADGRIVVAGATLNGRSLPAGVLAFDAAGTATGWQPNVVQTLTAGQPYFARALGDKLVLGGVFGALTPDPLQGLAVFALDGARAPSALQARFNGPATVFTWTPPAASPAGYQLLAGGAPGRVDAVIPLGATTTFSAVVPTGTFYVRVRTVGAAGGVEEVSNEIAVRGGCVAAPSPPTGLVAAIAGSLVTLSWTAPDALVDRYLLEVGTASGQTNLLTASVAGAQTSFAAAAPPATYFVRARAVNACGTSAPSGEVALTVGASDSLPAAPTGLGVVVNGSTVQFAWTAPAGPVTGYVLEAGLDLGLATLGKFAVGATPALTVTGVPPGVYVARVRAVNGAGSGAPSADVVIRVP